MPRKTKAVKQEPQVDIGAEIFASLWELEKLKGIPVDYMVERLKQALTNATAETGRITGMSPRTMLWWT